ncbi:YafY family protein [Kineosporia sp. A_224]|uniref:helix-turn-helix transcriptional regulator n=1 Tax=Kineosporia sp. A_224 TaxID=1962180 RepID=UPI000B4AA820|nr:WYL domain-containing protein [Kineosporia sp. A_224]
MESEAANPTSRALLALELIQNTPGITADRLAEKLGVSDRAPRRYVGILREAGIPIDASRGRYGGYRVGRGVRLPPLLFTAGEALGIVMAVLDGHHDAGDPTDPVGSALGKLMRAMPGPVAAQAEAVRRITAAAPDRAAVRPDAATTGTLVQACEEQRVVRITYRSGAGTQWSTDADPWAVVVRHGRWYLLCHAHASDAVRAYRVDRVRAVEVLERSFVPPADLDPVRLLEENLASGWEYEVEVVIDAAFADVVGRLPPTLGRLEPGDEGTTRLVGSTSNPVWYAEQLAVLPVPFHVVRGAEVARAARQIGLRLLAAAAAP